MSFSPNFVIEPFFLCKSHPHHFVASFISSLKDLAEQSKTPTKISFLDIEPTIKAKLGSIFEKLNQRHNRQEQAKLDDCDNEHCSSAQFLQIQKNQTFELQEHLKRCKTVLRVFQLSSAKVGLNLIKIYLLPTHVNEWDIEFIVIKVLIQFILSKFGEIQFLDKMNLLGGATSFDSFKKAYKTSEPENIFLYEWFDHPDKMQNTEFFPEWRLLQQTL